MVLSFTACGGRGPVGSLLVVGTFDESSASGSVSDEASNDIDSSFSATTTSGRTMKRTSATASSVISSDADTPTKRTTSTTAADKKTENNVTTTTTRPTAAPVKETDVKAVTPAHGTWIVLANDTVYNWWQTYDFVKTDSQPYVKNADIYYPNNVTLSWSAKKSPSQYRVTLSTKANMSGAKRYTVSGTKLELNDLFIGTTYYWQVEAIYTGKTVKSAIYCFFTADSPRCLKIEGVSNTRDIGGYAAGDGYRVKQGMIYRGAILDSITAAGKAYMLDTLGIKTDLDLRRPGEDSAGIGSPLGTGVNYININGRYYLGENSINSTEGKKIIAQEVRPFANPDNYPIFMHCSVGRDRTGCLALIIEGLLGMSKEDILMEYELFVFSRRGTMDGTTVAHMTNMIESVYRQINSKFYEGNNFAEKVENYLLSCGITPTEIEAIRTLMLEKVEE